MAYARVLERVFEIVIFGAAAWPLVRICANHGFRQKLRAFPKVALVIAAALAGYFLALAFVWRYVPEVIPAAALLLCGLLGYAWYRSRAVYGSARGLPPGSLAFAPVGPWNDYLFYQKQAEQHGSIFKMSNFTAPMVCIVGLNRAAELLRVHEKDLSVPPLPFNRFIPYGLLRYMDAEVHQEYAATFRATFTRTVIKKCESYTGQAVSHGLSEMAQASAQCSAIGVHPEKHVRDLAFVVFARMFFGLTPDADNYKRMQALYEVIDYYNTWRTPNFCVMRALGELVAIVDEVGQEVSDCFLSEALRVKPTALRDRSFIMNLLYIMLTGWHDVTGLLQWILKKLSEHPEWTTRLREELSASIDRGEDAANGLATRIVRETLRLEQSEYLMRRTLREIHVDDYVIPRGWLIRICVRESHRSTDAFKDPSVFDPDRFSGMGVARETYSPFGLSRRSCMGEYLTIAVGRTFVTELVGGFDWKVVSDGPREYGGFHWKPSSRFRLTLSFREKGRPACRQLRNALPANIVP